MVGEPDELIGGSAPTRPRLRPDPARLRPDPARLRPDPAPPANRAFPRRHAGFRH